MKLSWWIEGGEVIFRRGRRDRMDGPDGVCLHLALCLYSISDIARAQEGNGSILF
jgi:hypothetical protein